MLSSKTIAIHQPNYIPWLGYFYKIHQADIFVFHDDTQFSESGMHHYNYIKTPQGKFRLKIPVEKSTGMNINQILTKDKLGWKKKHLKTIEFNYKKARFFDEVYTDFAMMLEKDYENLAVMNQEIIILFCKKLGIDSNFQLSSKLNLSSTREEKIFDTCNKLNADIYFSGTGARAYQNEENFIKRGIQLKYSEFKPFQYFQLWDSFEPNVSIIDYLMLNGYDWNKVLVNQK